MHRRRFEIQKKNDTYLLSRFIEDQLACFDDHLQLQAHVIMLLKVKYTAHYTKERLILTLYRHRSRGYCCLFMRQSNNQSIRPNRITLELISIWCRIYESVNRASIASVNDLPPIRRQAIFWTNARLLITWNPRNILKWNFHQNTKLSFPKMHLKISSAKWRPISRGRDELILYLRSLHMICEPRLHIAKQDRKDKLYFKSYL